MHAPLYLVRTIVIEYCVLMRPFSPRMEHGVKDHGCWFKNQKKFCAATEGDLSALKRGLPPNSLLLKSYHPGFGDEIVDREAGWLTKLPDSIAHH